MLVPAIKTLPKGDAPYLVFAASQTSPSLLLGSGNDTAENAARVGTDGFLCLRIQEGDEKEWDVVLPRDPAVGSEVDDCYQIPVSVGPVRNQEFSGIYGIVHIPAAAFGV